MINNACEYIPYWLWTRQQSVALGFEATFEDDFMSEEFWPSDKRALYLIRMTSFLCDENGWLQALYNFQLNTTAEDHFCVTKVLQTAGSKRFIISR